MSAWTLSLVAALVSSAPLSSSAPRTQVLVLDLEAVNLPADQAQLVSGRIASVLDVTETLDALTMADLRQLAAFEADKQTVGCDQVSCLAEIANAMGARYVIFGRVARLGAEGSDSYLGQLNLFDAQSAQPVAREEWESGDMKALLDGTDDAAMRLVATLAPTPQGPSAIFLGGVAVASVGVIGAVALGLASALQYGTLSTSAPAGASASEIQKLRDDKAFAQDAAPVFFGLAIASALVGAGGAGLIALSFVVEE